jgi:hypothetical protein
MSLTITDNFFHFLILDIVLSFLLCFIIFIDKYFRKSKDTSEEKRRKYQKDFLALLAVGLIVYFM